MIKSQTEEYFDEALSNARILLSNKQQQDMNLEKKLEAFSDHKCEYAQFCIKTMHGLRGFYGSSMYEQNYSITLYHLNDSRNKINKYCEQPINLVKDIFGRQQSHTLIMKKSL